MMIISLYEQDLQLYGFYGLPKYKSSKSFNDRCDKNLVIIFTFHSKNSITLPSNNVFAFKVLLCKTCTNLKTLIIRERISTSTLILIAYFSKSLKSLIVRSKAIIKRCDWEKDPNWSFDFYHWLQSCSNSYQLTFNEISKIFGTKWVPLNDRQFKMIRPPQDF